MSDATVGDEQPARSSDYRVARIVAAIALFTAVLVIVIADPLLPEYQADAILVTTLLGCGAALLGVEIVDFVRRP